MFKIEFLVLPLNTIKHNIGIFLFGILIPQLTMAESVGSVLSEEETHVVTRGSNAGVQSCGQSHLYHRGLGVLALLGILTNIELNLVIFFL